MSMDAQREVWAEEQGDRIDGQEVVIVNVFDGAVTTEYRDVVIGAKSGTPDAGTTPIYVHDGRCWAFLGDADTGTDESEWLDNVADILEESYEQAVR